jgi:hypothetical protein
MPPEIRDWLAPDQWRGLEILAIEGRLKTDGDLFEQFDRQMVYQPEAFAVVDLDRYRLSLDDEDHARFVGGQKAIVEGRLEPSHVRYDWLRRGIDRTLKTSGIDTDGPVAAKVRAEARNELDSFEPIEGRAPVGADLDDIARRAVNAMPTPPPSDEVVAEESTDPDPKDATPRTPTEPDVTRFDDGTKLVARSGVDTERGKADVTEAYDEQDRIVSTGAVFADGHRVESRWSYPAEGHWSQVDTVHDPEGATLGAVTTTFDGQRVTRTAEPTDGPPRTDIWDRDGPVATVQNVAAPLLAIPFLLDLTAAAIGAVIVGKAIDDTIARQGTSGASGTSEMARPTDRKPGKGHNNPPEPVDDDKRPPSGPPMPPFPPGQRPSWRQSELDDAADRQPDFAPQVSFKDGKEVSSWTPDSVRPDGVSKDRRSVSFEMKNYDINTNADKLVSKVIEQVHERVRHLPPGMQQHIRIDVRGQSISSGQLDDIARRILEKANGLLRSEHITFMESAR